MIVPTVERGLLPADFCEIEIDGLRPADQVDVGLGHLAEKLPGEAGQTFARTAAALRHTACRRPASSCPSR